MEKQPQVRGNFTMVGRRGWEEGLRGDESYREQAQPQGSTLHAVLPWETGPQGSTLHAVPDLGKQGFQGSSDPTGGCGQASKAREHRQKSNRDKPTCRVSLTIGEIASSSPTGRVWGVYRPVTKSS